MSTQQIYAAVERAVARALPAGGPPRRHLDIGAGRGGLIERLDARFPLQSQACDFHVEQFKGNVPIKKIDIDKSPLPYADSEFDVVTCSEVIEHLENFRALLREAHRVLKPGGLLVLTTPNVLNAYSRLRYVASGFANLFGPLPVKGGNLYSTGHHISPIPYFYLAHALLDADFHALDLDLDKVQKTSVLCLVLLAPLILPGWLLFWQREENKYRTLTPDNRAEVARHLSWPVLAGRTVVVSCRRR
ncbi:MAG TPA: class I SAM-dependent methyltransferase [Burkholderiales bacterium]